MGMLKNFFNKSINENTYPFGTKECGKFLKEVYKESIDETLILKDDIYATLEQYDEIVENISRLEFKKTYIEHFLQNEMKEYETAFCKERKITWKTINKNSLDSKKLKLDNPDLANKYLKTNKVRVFKVF